jgi:hypothetical protein
MEQPQYHLPVCSGCGDHLGYVGELNPDDPFAPRPDCHLDGCEREVRCRVLDAVNLCEVHFRLLARDAAGWVEHLNEIDVWTREVQLDVIAQQEKQEKLEAGALE